MLRYVSALSKKVAVGAIAVAVVLAGAACAKPVAEGGDKETVPEVASLRPEDHPEWIMPAYSYELQGSAEVDGRQGVAAEGSYVWVSGSTTLSKYDADWNLVATNAEPFAQGYDLEVNHIGDIDVYQNEVYCGVELFLDGVASTIQIAVYDGDTLELKRTFNFEPESGQDECSGICVNPDDGTVWMCSWTDTGRYVYQYDLETGAYLGRVQLHASPQWIQGIAYHDGSFYVTADDGDADYDEPDHVYRFEAQPGAHEAAVAVERTLDDVTRQGEIEGLSFTDDGRMLVLYNRGARIILGMPSGFYDGYDHEIHEVFSYAMTDRAEADEA